MTKNNKLFDCFSLDILESRCNSIEVAFVNTRKFLKYDLSIFNENELVSILTIKRQFTGFEKKLIKFWACLFKSKELFEIGMQSKLTTKEFTAKFKRFIKTKAFTTCCHEITWQYAFTRNATKLPSNELNIYESIALSTAESSSITVDLIEKFNLLGVTWEHRGNDGETALTLLCRNECVTTAKLHLLFVNNNNINIPDVRGRTAFMSLCRNKSITTDMIQLFLTNTTNANIPDKFGTTAFMRLCANRNVTTDMIQLLLSNNTNANIQDEFGETALMLLCYNKAITVDMIKLFLDKGVDINFQNKYGRNAFMWLCSNESATIDMVKLFLNKGTDINFQDKFGITALMYLCENHRVTIDMIQFLLANGADITLQDKSEKTVLNYYLNNGGKDKEILKLLRQI